MYPDCSFKSFGSVKSIANITGDMESTDTFN